MIRNGKYRFTLQFGMNTEEEQKAGQLLELLGKKKSPIVVAALNEYMDTHPDILAGKGEIRFHIAAPEPKELEATIRKLLTQMLESGAEFPNMAEEVTPPSAMQVSGDILDMLTDLDLFG